MLRPPALKAMRCFYAAIEARAVLDAGGLLTGRDDLHELGLMTTKPFLYVFNADEAVLTGESVTVTKRAMTAADAGEAPLPGGDFAMQGADDLIARLRGRYPFFDALTAQRLVRSYGTDAFVLFGSARSLADCGSHFGHGLTEREVEWMRRREWAVTAQDVLWRRSKLGLRFSPKETETLSAWLAQ